MSAIPDILLSDKNCTLKKALEIEFLAYELIFKIMCFYDFPRSVNASKPQLIHGPKEMIGGMLWTLGMIQIKHS